MKGTFKTTDDSVKIYEARDLSSPVIIQLPEGADIELGDEEILEKRVWLKATLADGNVGYLLGPTAHGHTTLGSRGVSPMASSDWLTEDKQPATVVPKILSTADNKLEKNANAALWDCSNCTSPAGKQVIASRNYFAGVVCDKCGRVLCDKCARNLDSRICQCSGLLVKTPFDLRKKPLSLTGLNAVATGEMRESTKTALGFLLIVLLVGFAIIGVVKIGDSDLTFMRGLRYAVITIGIIVASVGAVKKNGLLFLGAAIITAGRYLEYFAK